MEMTIRRSDNPEVFAFFNRAFAPDAIRPAMLEWTRLEACDEVYVAEGDGQIVGAVTLATAGLYGGTMPTLATLFVAPELHRHGIGRRLCEFAIRRFVELEKTPVYIDATSRGMKALIASLPDDLKDKLGVHYSVDVEGDEWEPFDGGGAFTRTDAGPALSAFDCDASQRTEDCQMVYFVDQLEAGQNLAGYQKNLDGFSNLTREAAVFLWRNLKGTLSTVLAT